MINKKPEKRELANPCEGCTKDKEWCSIGCPIWNQYNTQLKINKVYEEHKAYYEELLGGLKNVYLSRAKSFRWLLKNTDDAIYSIGKELGWVDE